MVNPTNDKIMIKTSSNETRLPTLNRFLSSITGSGLTSDTSGLSINNVQSFLNINSDYLKIYGSSGNHSNHYINIGKGDDDNLKISCDYNNSNNLKSVNIKTTGSGTDIHPNIEFGIGDKTNVLDIHENGLSVKGGF